MHLTAICPTFRRPRLIPNILAMFQAQEFPQELCRLIIYDDGGSFTPQVGPGWEMVVRPARAPTLGGKFAEIVEIAISRGTDAIVLFEDDDVYFPGYLAAHASGLEQARWNRPERAFCNKGRKGRALEARNAHHGCWGFRVDAYLSSGGYPEQNEAFDLAFGKRMQEVAGDPHPLFRHPDAIEYLYRWGTTGYSNGSGFGASIYESTARSHAPETFPGRLFPRFDEETLQFYHDYHHGRFHS